MEHEARSARQLWVEDEKGRRRMPDPVRTAAVRAVMITSLTLIQGMVAFFAAITDSWLAFPMLLSSVGSTVVATWSVLDVWVTRQVWRQRNGVVSEPSSTARPSRRERRRAQKAAARVAEGEPGHEAGEQRAGHEAGEQEAGHEAAAIRRTEAPALSEAA
ncbi:hypothetical protein Q5762_29370 [Streptomyces sp. P9(2023)]|uniref:hypothetical protein n=1 Tax=Streptomyces sp. P9(2023) TaxID=3064394 RepID=UPI0028F4402B|nr:hypothetical protein [Streptomyces sp. P9(2023)]MDT9692367.1 hypothetical protein [Streptomyces sp. P9(2023)]